MRNDHVPLVSIGLAVYNGERYLRGAIEDLLAQDYGNFELIICDNASTDNTLAICQEYMAKDQRIRLYKNDSNIGSAHNFNKVFHLASGKYFMWASHDDLWARSYISKCVAKLEENDAAVMCTSVIQLIDEFGNELDVHESRETVGMDLVQRVQMLMAPLGGCVFYGVVRSEILRKTTLMQRKFGPDMILLLELALLGEFVKVPEILFFYRFIVKPLDKYMTSIDPLCKTVHKPFTGLARELLQVILRSNLDDCVKENLQYEFIECLTSDVNSHWRELIYHENLPASAAVEPAHLKNILLDLLKYPTNI